MIAMSRLVACLAVLISVAVHAAAGLMAPPVEPPQVEGGAGAAAAQIGSSFADLVQGRQSAAPPDSHAPQPEVTEIAPQPVARAVPPASPRGAMVALAPTTAAPMAAVLPVGAVPASVPMQQPVLEPVQEPVADPAAVRAPKRLTALAAAGGVEAAPRPPARPQHFASLQPKPAPVPKAPPKSDPKPVADPAVTKAARPPAAAPGNASVNAKRGSETASRSTPAAQASQGSGALRQAGSAAAANYGGLVLRAISRAKRGALDSDRRVLVRFAIAGGGGLASVAVARSSGNARADRAAMAQVQRAAPFPVPPAGARRSFVVEIGNR